jgi:hypothetical protein
VITPAVGSCNLHGRSADLHGSAGLAIRIETAQVTAAPRLARGELTPARRSLSNCRCEKETPMDLTVWLPALFLLGLAALGLMYAFTVACEKV